MNIADLYAGFAEDMRNGTHHCPRFDHAVTRHELVDAVVESAARSQREASRAQRLKSIFNCLRSAMR
ncbi:hypothetical protein [Bradyrhizobium sp. AZCC 2289]|uniref:hypothetical protein n=1 Tax=Bradyrhizobium sp. AZCC 2289 TaxID=3117026 RepID=UPI002FEEC31C